MSRCSPVLAALLTAVALGEAAGAPIPPPKRPVVEVVFCLDTTKDMEAALASLRSRFLTICERCVQGRPPARLRVGLVAYRDRGDEYVTRVFDLTDDPRAVRSALDELRADGGGDAMEGVNQGLHEAVHAVSWGVEKGASRQVVLIGSAPPHGDSEEDVPYPVTCEAAVERGIVIHAVQLGDDEECAACWQEIAKRAGGRFVRCECSGLGAGVLRALRPDLTR